MKLHVLFDRSGTILAAVPLDDEDARAPKPRPVPQRGQFTADVTVPARYGDMSFFDVCTRMKVRGRDKGAELIAAPAATGATGTRGQRKARPASRARR
jgi:hypothetical protein